MGLLSTIFGNTRKPEGTLGRMFTKSMNTSVHAKMADWGLSFLNGVSAGAICDFGCGGGRNVGEFLKRYPDAKVWGFDHSPVSVEATREYNAADVKAGRCEVIQGNVKDITLPEGSLDLASAFETVYFWPGLKECFLQVHKTLKDGGRFLIVNEADGEDGSNEKWEKIIDMRTYTRAELEDALKQAGFSSVSTHHHETKPWIAVLAEK